MVSDFLFQFNDFILEDLEGNYQTEQDLAWQILQPPRKYQVKVKAEVKSYLPKTILKSGSKDIKSVCQVCLVLGNT